MSDTLKIALGVAIGILVAGAIGWAARLYMIKTTLDAASQAIHEVNAEHQAKVDARIAEQRRKAWEVQQARERQVRLAREAELRRMKLEQIKTQRQQDKQQAWYAWYQPPEGCGESNGDLEVKCINHRIRAKRQFNEAWASTGKPPGSEEVVKSEAPKIVVSKCLIEGCNN